jgi:hypothetical protein
MTSESRRSASSTPTPGPQRRPRPHPAHPARLCRHRSAHQQPVIHRSDDNCSVRRLVTANAVEVMGFVVRGWLACRVWCVPRGGCGSGMRRRIAQPHPSGGTPFRCLPERASGNRGQETVTSAGPAALGGRCATCTGLTSCSNMPAACSRTISRRARPTADRPPLSGISCSRHRSSACPDHAGTPSMIRTVPDPSPSNSVGA